MIAKEQTSENLRLTEELAQAKEKLVSECLVSKEKLDPESEELARKTLIVQSLPTNELGGREEFLNHLGPDMAEQVHTKASAWIRDEGGRSMQEIIEAELVEDFLNGLDLLRVPSKRAEKYLAALCDASSPRMNCISAVHVPARI